MAAAAATAEGEQTPCKNLKGSDNNLYLTDILISLRNSGTINVDAISKSTYPRDIVRHSGNTSYIRYCLELVEFVAASNPNLSDCIGTLADLSIDSNDEVLRNASEILANACAEKIEEFDGKKVRKKTAIGFGSRIRDYKKKIAQLMGSSLEAEIRNEASQEIRAQYLNCAKAHDRLGWKPLHTMEEGLQETVEWYRHYLASH